jgi:hypothetical protein
MKENLTIDDVYLIRCIVTKVNTNTFEGKDYNGKKYIIAKNEVSKNFDVGTDSTFYATKEEQGLIFKKEVLIPLSKREYEELFGTGIQSMNIDEKCAAQ